jgi:molecular chaperone GrpE
MLENLMAELDKDAENALNDAVVDIDMESPVDAAAEVEIEETDLLAEAQEQIASLKDQALRAQAEQQNIRRRAELDVEKAHKFGSEKLVKELLPILDNLERALATVAPEDEVSKSLAEGVQMTLDMFVSGLAKFKCEVVNPEGEPFNPEVHQAMSMVENPDMEPNTVMAVMQKGYTLQGRLMRPAMVVVSKGAAKVDAKA